jgi:DNA-3-methyladenine glycosylase II
VLAPDADVILAARQRLAARDPALAVAHAAVPPFPWRTKPPGYAGLAKMIIEQQVSVASAAAIWARFEAGLGEVAPEVVLAADETRLRSFGLSGQKARYVRNIAEAHASGFIDFDHIAALSDAEAVARLTAIKGVGLWTAETYLLFCEGRLDVFPAGDIALQEGLRLAERAAERLKEKALYARAEAWRPDRGVAAHLLWSYYGAVKRGEVVPPPVENA